MHHAQPGRRPVPPVDGSLTCEAAWIISDETAAKALSNEPTISEAESDWFSPARGVGVRVIMQCKGPNRSSVCTCSQ
jgi:hypothetical protein